MKGWIYIIQSGEDEKYKIGCTEKNPNKRLKELDKTGNPDILTLIDYFEVEDMYFVEKEIHNQLKEYRIRRDREWFKIDLKKLKHIVDEFIENLNINEINENHLEKEKFVPWNKGRSLGKRKPFTRNQITTLRELLKNEGKQFD